MSIKENLEIVKQSIEESCKRANIDNNVTLVAVSKTKPTSDIISAYNEGQRIFGENYVQEIVSKYEEIGDKVEFHMIGHLQRNKVKYIVDKVKAIHSVDSLRLADAINKECAKKDIVMNILVEVNIAREETKWGFMPEETLEAIKYMSKLPNIKVIGLMTSAPNTDNPENNRCYFRDLKKLMVDINAQKLDNICMYALSMGMSNDYMVAVEEGATYVRVGSSIFGSRNYNNQEEN